MAGRKKKSAGRMPLWLYVLIVVAIALVTYFRTSGEPEAGDPQPPAASAAAQQTPADETLTVRFLDVGQGDSILLACGDETMLIDGGPVEEGQFLVSRLNRLDVAKLTYVINTHPDEDHCGGLAAVLAKYPAEHVYSSVTEYTTKVFSNVVKYADEQGHPVEVPQTGGRSAARASRSSGRCRRIPTPITAVWSCASTTAGRASSSPATWSRTRRPT